MTLVSTAAKGGGPAAGTYLATGHASGVSLDTTTYTDPVTGGALRTLVFPNNQTALSLAISGDAFPRVLLLSDPTDGIYLDDGTEDSYLNYAAIRVNKQTGARARITLGTSNLGDLALGQTDTNRGFSNRSALGLTLDGSAAIRAGTGAPGIGGVVGDIYIRADGGALSTLYRCTGTGGAGVATWAGIL